MQYSFDPEIAVQYGVNEAIFLQNIAFWIQKNRANRKHLHDGRYWTYNSQQALTELFPFWTRNQIRRIIDKCITMNALLTGNYSEDQTVRTTWYALTDEAAALFFPDAQKPTNASDENHQCIGGNPPMQVAESTNVYKEQIVNITDTPYSPPQGEDAQQAQKDRQDVVEYGFQQFWELYPRKVDKQKAHRAWTKLKPDVDMCIDIIRALGMWKRCRQWQDPQYIPHPSTWINNRRWEVSPDGVQPAAPEPVPREVEEWT